MVAFVRVTHDLHALTGSLQLDPRPPPWLPSFCWVLACDHPARRGWCGMRSPSSTPQSSWGHFCFQSPPPVQWSPGCLPWLRPLLPSLPHLYLVLRNLRPVTAPLPQGAQE